MARRRLREGLKKLPELALNLEQPAPRKIRAAATEPQWFLLLDHEEHEENYSVVGNNPAGHGFFN